MPDDLAYVEENKRYEISVDELPQDKMLIDIGQTTIDKYSQILKSAGTIFINGPVGVFKKKLSANGTKAVWEMAADSAGFSVVGGGDSVAAVNLFKVDDK